MSLTMARLFTCTLLATGCAVISNGVYGQQKMRYSVDVGATVSCFNLQTPPFAEPVVVAGFSKACRSSIEAGVNADYILSNVFSLSSGLRYVETGGAYKTNNPNFFYIERMSGHRPDDAYNYLRYRLVYMGLPVLVKLSVYEMLGMKATDTDLRLYGGVAGMLNLGSRLRYNVFSNTAKESWKSEHMDGAERFVVSSVAGAEWREGPLILYARYTRSIGKVYDTSKPGYENFNLQMHTISLGLGLVIR